MFQLLLSLNSVTIVIKLRLITIKYQSLLNKILKNFETSLNIFGIDICLNLMNFNAQNMHQHI